MKKIIVMLMAIMCFFAATANAASQITDVKWGVINNNALRFVVDMTDLAPYKVNLDTKYRTLEITISAPFKNVGNGGKSYISTNTQNTVTNQLIVSSSGRTTVIKALLNSAITTNDYRVFTLKKDTQNNRPARIVVDITSPKKNPPPAPAKVLKSSLEYFLVQPNWYDEYGQLACTFVNNSTFTEKGKTYKAHIEERELPTKLPDGRIVAAHREFLVLNDNGKLTEREISRVLGVKGVTMFLILPNYPTALQSTKTIPYTDSIGGVHLGMPRRQVEQLYGAPDSSDVNNNGSGTVKYNKDNWEIIYHGNRVIAITIHKGGTRRFDRTGLGCDSSLDSFARAYNINHPISTNRFPGYYGAICISKDNERMYREYLWFINNGDIKLIYEDLT